MSDLSDQVSEVLARRLSRGMDIFAEKLVEDIQEKISVPVEYQTGPRGGQVVIRSKPGEPPRKENGDLWESIENIPTTREAQTKIVARVVTRLKVAGWLQNGTKYLDPRPFWPAQDEMDARSDELIHILVDNF